MKSVDVLIGILVLSLLTTSLIPTIFSNVKTTNTSDWSSSEITIWGVIPLFILFVIIVAYYYVFKRNYNF